ncbi:hypothetical protein AB0P37_15635 [Streptomyces antimycoticus]|uniref:hypothetical protein n=3 Tax=Streptomyces TaxID=1883 RepID=UPI000B2922A9|nr:hypothetical protein OG546_38955 [Streptomyces antimycoticus]
MHIAELILKYVQALAWPAVTLTVLWFLRAHLRDTIARMSRLETPVGAIEFAAAARDVLRQSETATDSSAISAPPQTSVPPPVSTPQPPPFGGDTESPPPATGERAGEPGDRPQPGGPLSGPRPGSGAGYGYPGPVPAPRPAEYPPFQNGGYSAHIRGTQLREARHEVDAAPAGAVATAWNALHALCADVVTAVGLPAPSHPSEVGARLTSLGASPYTVMVIERLHRLSADALREPAAVTPNAARDYVDACLAAAENVERLRQQWRW